ncbi:MAG: SDR family NAD(P)-dependent oxidoreductase [Betaproteobacteria bacterium]|nr:SDR family NAD(P)-dependent oxidoreductase [Betaproteobacteria bacterium]
MHSLPHGYTALVIGASGTIGQAFYQAIAADPACAGVVALSRSTHPGFDLDDPGQLAAALSALPSDLSLVIDATGILSTDPAGPEKSLSAVHPQNFHRLMQINAVGPLMLLRELAPRLARGRCLYGKLSARVGSISDNRLGGWYSYRASKAALNMLLQTAAIELQRRLPGLVVAAMQPGTVRSPLSQRFVSAATDTVPPDEAAQGLLAALDAMEPGPGARFVDYRGKVIPW